MLNRFALFILTFITTSSALAGDCSFIDVRENMAPALREHFYKPLHQGSIGWCYAYAASDMMAQAVGTPVSAIYTGAYYNTKMNFVMKFLRGLIQDAEVPEGGFTHIAIKDMQSSGMLCKESVLTSQAEVKNINTKNGKGSGSITLLFYYLEHYRKNTCQAGNCDTYLDGLIEVYFPGISVEEVKRRVLENPNERLEVVVGEIFREACSQDPIHIQKNQFSVRIQDKSTGTGRMLPGVTRPTVLATTDRLLENGKVIGVEYDASYVDPRLSYLNKYHASTVIGREQVGSTCYYRVRNTWGKNFNHYARGILFGGADGTYLVDRKTFQDMTIRILWIE